MAGGVLRLSDSMVNWGYRVLGSDWVRLGSMAMPPKTTFYPHYSPIMLYS